MVNESQSLPSLADRASGILLHPTSLPGPFGSGDLGDHAIAFADYLARAGQSFWQTLPLGPVGYGDSPYSAESAFAGEPLLASLDSLVEDGLLARRELEKTPRFARSFVDFERVRAFRESRMRLAFDAFVKDAANEQALAQFRHAERAWLPTHALYRALKRKHGGRAWIDWPDRRLRLRDPATLTRARIELANEIAFHEFEQLRFAKDWAHLRAHCHKRRVALIGDLPIFVAHDSADVWEHRDLFRLDARGRPTVVAGVPPDYFSATGQRWGNPLYRWTRMKKNRYAWWTERMRMMFRRFDVVRVDHFIGFQRYWEIPSREETAIKGRWMKGPGHDFFAAVAKELGPLPLIAEDLGAVTPAVKKLRDDFHFPGIKVLQFAFGTDPSAPDFLPYNHPRRSVVYTGTHDNDTTVGWFHDAGGAGNTRSAAQVETERRAVLAYLGSDGHEINWDMIRLAMSSVARTAIVPMQDVLGLGAESRMNRPSFAGGNWRWRARGEALTPEVADRLRALTSTYGRIFA